MVKHVSLYKMLTVDFMDYLLNETAEISQFPLTESGLR